MAFNFDDMAVKAGAYLDGVRQQADQVVSRAQQQAEQMQFVLDKQRKESERMRVEASGFKDSAVIRAEGEAQALKLVSQALSDNPSLLTYRYIEKLAPNLRVMMLPSNSPFMLDMTAVAGLGDSPSSQPVTATQTGASVPTPEPELPFMPVPGTA